MPFFSKSIEYLRRKRRVPNLEQSVDALQDWFASPLGADMLAEQQKVLDEVLSCLFGYHLLQLSVHQNAELYSNSRVCHCFSAGPGRPRGESGASLYSQWDELPLEDESVDVTVLHHALDFSSNPHQVLREACRVTIARGYIVVVGFNPFSPMGMFKPLAQLFSSNPIWQRNSLRRARVDDWLNILDCQVVNKHSSHYSPPIRSTGVVKHASRLNKKLSRWPLPMGNFYCLVARKDRTALTPIRPKWLVQPALVPASKQAISARSAAKLTIIQGTKPNSPSK